MLNCKIVVGFITHSKTTFKYLPYFVESLKQQTVSDFFVLVQDNSTADDLVNEDWLKQNLPTAKIKRSGENLGFARAANQLIERAKTEGADYFFLLNPDTILDNRVVEKLVEFMATQPDTVAASPKVLRWDFVNKIKTNIIDTCGLTVRPGFKFVDVGQGEVDNGQYDEAEILGPSGCSAFFRLSALGEIRFDEQFFMYKEDCDLVYQLFLAGKKCAVVSSALVYHDRTIAKGSRRDKSRQAKIWSFLGQQLLIKKYWRTQNFWSKGLIIGRQILLFGYILIFELYLLKESKNL